MYAVLLVAVSLILLISLIWKLTTSKSSTKSKSYLLFIDAPDPDNPAAALAIWNHRILCRNKSHLKHQTGHLHIILSGRQINLKTVNKPATRDNILRQSWENNNPNHAQRVLEDSAVRITNYLTKCGVPPSAFTIYNGGIAPCAPISDVIHVVDFIFDRKDLVTGQVQHQGDILEPEEYNILLERYSSLKEEERERKLLTILRRCELIPLRDLAVKVSGTDICIFLGGPATALVDVFSGSIGKELCDNVKEFYGMFGSLDPGENTLLPNQFNVACDIESASTLFVGNLLPNVPKHLITTETAKLPNLVVSSDELEARGVNPYIVKLQRLWEAAHQGRPQPLFDILAVMASLDVYRDCFMWLKKKAVVQEWMDKDGKLRQIFSFAESESPNLVVSSDCYNSDRETYIQFLMYSFKDFNRST